MEKRKIIVGILGAAAILGSLACATTGGGAVGPPAPSMTIDTPGVTITVSTELGESVFVAGQTYSTYSTPFSSSRSYYLGLHAEDANVVSMYSVALNSMGARKIMISYPGRDKPLYGVLLLCDIYPGSTGPASRSYQIQVPQQYVDAASNGRVSVVYEKLNSPQNGKRDSGGKIISTKSWVLWLSDMPFGVGK
jgi:hypothetical protein